MNRRKTNIFVYILLGLGVFGLLYTLFTKPGSLLVQIGMIFLFIGAAFLIYKLFLKRRMGGKEYTAYLRAAKQSKRRLTDQKQRKANLSSTRTTSPRKATVSSIHKKKKNTNTHLTVIEGKKGKKKNRAFF